jgi:hypothetical protein
LYLERLEDRTLLSGATAAAGQPAQAYGQLPLIFEANQGQTAAQVNYLSHGQGYTLFLTPTQAVLALSQGSGDGGQGSGENVVQMGLVDANPSAQTEGLDRQAGVSNYLLGNDPSQWITNVAHYGRVEYQNVYPGIDVVYYGNNQTQLEYDFDVAPGGSPAAIQLAFQGAQGLTVDGQGDLVLHTAGANVTEQAPVAYQMIDGVRQAVAVQFALEGNGQVGFQVGAYDPRQALVIDPVLSYSTYLGGSTGTAGTQEGAAIAVDSAGNAYVTGVTPSTSFPTTPGAFQVTDPEGSGYEGAFVTKLNASGTGLVYSTYLGGSSGDVSATGIAVDSAGNAYVTGYTNSPDFPTTAGAYQTTNRGMYGSNNAFVTELNASSSGLVYSTFLGGDSGYGEAGTMGTGIAVDSGGNAYVTGYTLSTDFPTTAGAPQTTSGGGFDGFVAKLNAGGAALVYGTYLGGSGRAEPSGIAVDGAGNAYVTGWTMSSNFPTTAGAFQTTFAGSENAFVTELNASGTAWVYSTYLGGSGSDSGAGIAVDGAGDAYVTGQTSSANFPTTPGAFQMTIAGNQQNNTFVTKLNPSGTGLVYSTFLGTSNGIGSGGGIALDGAGDAYVTGETSSTHFPTTPGAVQTTGGGNTFDAVVTELNTSGSALVYSTYLGGSGGDVGYGIAVDSAGNFYVTGRTSAGFPTTAGAFQTTSVASEEAFVAKFTAGLALSPLTLPPATLGAGYNQTLSANGGTAPCTYALTTGSLPAGLSLSSAGVLSGTPTAVGSSAFTVTATDSNGLTGSQAYTLTVGQPAASLSVSGFPSPTTAGVTGTVTVMALNANGTTDTGYTGTVQLTSSDPKAVLPANYTFTAADQGVHTFTVTLKTAGSQSITATDTSTGSVTASETGITVNPAATAALVFSGVPSSTTAGSAFTLTLTAEDAYGNTTPGYTGTVHFTSSDAKAALPANYTFTAADAGVHTFSAALKTAGTQSITVTDSSTASITGTDGGITVKPAAASKFLLIAPSGVTHGVAFSLTLTVLDAYGNVVTGYRGTVHFSSTDGTAVLPANYTFTAGDAGVHTFTGLVLHKKGKQTITATDMLNSALTASLTEQVA